MHPAQVKAELSMRGMTLAKFDKEHGYPTGATSAALRDGSPRVERAIAAFLDLPVQTLFPKRYTRDGQRLLPRERVDPAITKKRAKARTRSNKTQKLAS